MKILLIDNYDSFTYNVYRYLRHYVSDVYVRKNDEITIQEIENALPDKIVISPGPGKPEDSGISLKIVQHFKQRVPIFGICLGHQIIAHALGGKIIKSKTPSHGKTTLITHNESGIYAEIPQKIEVGLYHSLIVEPKTLPKEFEISSISSENKIMGIRHKYYPLEGVQFHPESIMTEFGYKMIENWIKQ